jgi:Caspase domain
MRVTIALVILSFVGGALARDAAAQQADTYSAASRVALVIGNASYPSADPGLTQPVGNARAVGDELQRDGFDVEVKESLSKEAMQRALGRLYGKIKPGTDALVFFSGFGIQSNRQSYMIPVDAQIYKEDDVRHDGISVDSVLSELDKRGAGVKIVILDASRRTRYEDNFRPAPLGLALPANPPSGTLVMYSAGSHSVVREPPSDRSLFVSELLNEMRAPGVTAEEVFKSTRAGVLRASQSQQNPTYFSSLNEEFSFGQSAAPPKTHTAKAVPPVIPAEPRDYDLTHPDRTVQGGEEPLDKHPEDHSGASARDVGDKVSKLNTSPGAEGAPPQLEQARAEQDATRVKDMEAIKDLDTYIANHPDDAASLSQRGQLYAKINDYPLAIKDFDGSLKLRPKNAEALNNRCWSRAMLGHFRTALKDCNEALQIRPGYADALDSRGFVQLKLRQPSLAIADYNEALQIKKQASSLYGRGLAKKQTGDSAGGDSDIAAAKAIDPSIATEFE